MIRHRVHMVITADELAQPVSFRTDVILTDRDPERACRRAKGVLIDQDHLTCAHILSNTVEMIELPTHPQETQK